MISFHLKWIKTWAIANFRSLSFYLLTIILLLGFGFTDSVIKETQKNTEVLVYVDNSQVGEYVLSYLENQAPDGFNFLRSKSIEELKRSIRRSDVPCGVVFSADSDNYHNQSGVVNIYQSAGSVDGYVVKEIIYPIMYRADGEERLKQYLAGLEWVDKDIEESATEYVLDWYSDYLVSTELKIYEVVQTSENTGDLDKNHNLDTTVIIYLAIILFAGSICIYDTVGSDRGFYGAFNRRSRIILYVEKVGVTLLLSVIISVGLKCIIF